MDWAELLLSCRKATGDKEKTLFLFFLFLHSPVYRYSEGEAVSACRPVHHVCAFNPRERIKQKRQIRHEEILYPL